MSDSPYEGGCLCGEVRYRAAADAILVGYCHCRSCTLAGGAPFVAWATFPVERFAFTKGRPAENASSEPVRRTFCPRCGTPLTYTHAARVGEIDVTFATLDDPGGLVPQCHVWASERRPWVRIGDDLPRYSQWPGSPLVS